MFNAQLLSLSLSHLLWAQHCLNTKIFLPQRNKHFSLYTLLYSLHINWRYLGDQFHGWKNRNTNSYICVLVKISKLIDDNFLTSKFLGSCDYLHPMRAELSCDPDITIYHSNKCLNSIFLHCLTVNTYSNSTRYINNEFHQSSNKYSTMRLKSTTLASMPQQLPPLERKQENAEQQSF